MKQFDKHDLFGCYGNVWIRQKLFEKAGDKIRGHKHNYDHVSLLAQGSVRTEVDGVIREFTAPTFLVIPKDKVHEVTATSDDVLWYCIFANRTVNGDVYDPELCDPSFISIRSHEGVMPEDVSGFIDPLQYVLNPDGSVQKRGREKAFSTPVEKLVH